MSSRKRARTVSTPRPIVKSMVHVSEVLTQNPSNNFLFTCTFPCTITGLRWDLSTAVSNSGPAADDYINWAIVLVKEGNTAGGLPVGTDSPQDFYNPEQNVLAFGSHVIPVNAIGFPWRGNTKTMRKLQTGDEFRLVIRLGIGLGNDNAVFAGAVQFFCKS